MEALADVARELRLSTVELISCSVAPDDAPALVRLLEVPTLTELSLGLDSEATLLRDGPAVEMLADALRANRTLQRLVLEQDELWDDAAACSTLLESLVGHASLRCLTLACNATYEGDDLHDALGAALGAMVAADSPALDELDLLGCYLRDLAFLALFDALPRNTHLRTLNLRNNLLSPGCLRLHLLPAVQANTSLRTLDLETGFVDDDADDEEVDWDEINDVEHAAVELVEARAEAEGGATLTLWRCGWQR